MPTTYESLLVSGTEGWHDGTGTLTFTLLTEVPDYYRQVDTDNDGIVDSWSTYPGNPFPSVPIGASVALSAAEADLARFAYAEWNLVARVNLVESAAGTVGDLTIGVYDFLKPSGKPNVNLYGWVADFPNGGDIGTPSDHGDVWINNSNPYQEASVLGATGFNTYLHEIGHALGLHHPDEDPTNTAGDPRNNIQWTVMSYVPAPSEAGLPLADQGYSITPMVLDIQAIQALYGANMTTRTGDTTYLGAGAGGELGYQYGADNMLIDGRNVSLTIWDAGGIDLIDASDVLGNSRIDLRPGTYSTVGGNATNANNVGLAAAVKVAGVTVNLIENATGGVGNDEISGNQARNFLRGGAGEDMLDGRGGSDRLFGAQGADTLIGGTGNDQMTGGGAADVFVFGSNAGRDTITDFQNGIDHIRITDGAAGFADIVVSATSTGQGTILSFGLAEVRLQGVEAGLIDASDFLFG